MTDTIDVMELAHEIAQIASQTSAPDTGRHLMEVVEQTLRAAGLLPGSRGWPRETVPDGSGRDVVRRDRS